MIDSGAADSGDLHVGDRTTVRVPDPLEVTVVGIAELGSGDSLGGVTFTWFDTETAQQLLIGDDDAITSVNLTAAPGVDPDQLVAAISPVLPDGLEAVTGATLTAEDDADIAADFLDFFEVFLLVFAGVALLVATFTIHNTLSIVVAQRTRESALLRALGASRRQVLTAVVIESLIVGIVASGIGLIAGLGLANGLNALLDAVGFGIPTSALSLDQGTVIASFVVGIAVTLVASLTPALKASRVAPLAALRDVDVDRSGSSIVRAVIGGLVTAAGVALVVVAPETPDAAMSRMGIGALLTLIGFVMVGPVVARWAASGIGAPIALAGGQTGKLARRNAMRNPRRTAGTASALMLGTAVVALFATFGASLKRSLDELIADAYEGDLVIVQDGFSGAGLSPELADGIAALPEVETATGLAFAAVTIDGSDEEPFAMDPPKVDDVVDLGVVAGSLDTMDAGGLAVSQSFADDKGWELGSEVSIGYADGVVESVAVQAVFEDANILGDLLMHEDAWLAHTTRSDDFIVMVALADGVSVDEGRAAVAPIDRTVRSARRSGPRRVPRVGDRRARPDARSRVRPARSGDPDRPARHRQHAVAQSARAHPRARPATSRRPDPPPTPTHRAVGERDHRRVRHRRWSRPRHLPRLGHDAFARGERGDGHLRRTGHDTRDRAGGSDRRRRGGSHPPRPPSRQTRRPRRHRHHLMGGCRRVARSSTGAGARSERLNDEGLEGAADRAEVVEEE